MQRIIIYNKDIQVLTGRSERYARTLLRKIRLHYGKKENHLVTAYEFCGYTGIDVGVVLEKLK